MAQVYIMHVMYLYIYVFVFIRVLYFQRIAIDFVIREKKFKNQYELVEKFFRDQHCSVFDVILQNSMNMRRNNILS